MEKAGRGHSRRRLGACVGVATFVLLGRRLGQEAAAQGEPGGGLSPDRTRWIACPPGFFLSVKVLGRLFRRLFMERLAAAFAAGELRFSGDLAVLGDAKATASPKSTCA